MGSKIRILDEQLTNQIAAGEVVERPASAVKELVENSLDAGANRVQIETRAGGKSLIRITDNGQGMNQDDLLLALERHATSKIATSDDLFAITTMGFRGEAVPAIGSVSKIRLSSKERGALSGYEVYAEGGKVLSVKEAGLPEGTSIEVRSLFYNTPGRRNFMKSASVELGHITDAVTRLALPKKEVYFDLVDSGNTILRVPASEDDTQRVAALLGRDVARSLIPVEGSFDHFSISGYIGSPEVLRTNARQIFFYVNERYVRDRLVFAALRRAYEGHIPKNRYPVTLLFLTIDPTFVDVNVHPAKLEIRFRRGPRVYDGIVDVISRALAERFGTGRARSVFDPLPPGALERRTPPDSHKRPTWERDWSKDKTESDVPLAADAEKKQRPVIPVLEPDPPSPSESPDPRRGQNAEFWPKQDLHVSTRIINLDQARQDRNDRTGSGPYSGLEIIGQLLNCYIVCQSNENEGSLVLIDQHAAHERILFEKLSTDYYNSAVSVQALLLPVTLDLPHSDRNVLEKILPELRKSGIEVEPFGGGTYRVTALPAVMSDTQGKQLILDCVERARETGKARTEGFADDVLQLLACHSAVRAGQALTVGQMREILRGLDKCKLAGSCPHGRPTTKEIPLEDLERFFGRRQ